MKYKAIKKFILDKLINELPEYLSYHRIAHVKDVLQASIVIGRREKVNEEDLILLKTAALFHDSGFIYGSTEHEEKSCEIARKYLPDYDYTTGQIEKICGMIMATKLPQRPHNHLEEILADADLDYLGRDDFFIIGDRLFKELVILDIISSEEEWNQLQVNFFKSHQYFTETSKNLRETVKAEHLAIIKSKLQ